MHRFGKDGVRSFKHIHVGWYEGQWEWISIPFSRRRLIIDRRSTHWVSFGEREHLVEVHYWGPITWKWRDGAQGERRHGTW